MSKYLEENFVLNLILDRQKKLANMQVFKGEKFSIDAVVLSSNLRTIVLSYDSLPDIPTFSKYFNQSQLLLIQESFWYVQGWNSVALNFY